MRSQVKYIIGAVIATLMLTSCDKISFHVNYVSGPSLMLTVTCEINNTDPDYFVAVECDAEQGTSYIVRTHSMGPKEQQVFEDTHTLRCIVDLYRVTNSHSEFVERRMHYVDMSNLSIPASQFNVTADEYKVLVWCDYITGDDLNESYCYQTDDLRNIRYNDIEVVDNNLKDAFTAVSNINLRDYKSTLTGVYDIDEHIILERPNGVMKCVTTDIKEYLSANDVDEITCVMTYTQYVAAGYSVEEQKPNYFEIERNFTTTVPAREFDTNNELVVCRDYVFVNGKQTNVKINMKFYNGRVSLSGDTLVREDGSIATPEECITSWPSISVPLKRNMETIVSGRLLTTTFDPGGIGINPGFEDEIVIPWYD